MPAEPIDQVPVPPGPASGVTLDFPPATRTQWRQEAEKLLKGAPFDKKLLTPTPEGITLQPIYWPEDVAGLPHLGHLPGQAPFTRGTACLGHRLRPWLVCQELATPDPAAFNRQARQELDRGLEALNIRLDLAARRGQDPAGPSAPAGPAGLVAGDAADLARSLAGIDTARIPVFIQTGQAALPLAALLAAALKQSGTDRAAFTGAVELDPLGTLAVEGQSAVTLESLYDEMTCLTGWAAERMPGLATIAVRADIYHQAGGHSVQELAFGLAAGVEYLRQMAERGLPADLVAPRIRFTFAAGPHFFMEVAKLRAARWLWAGIVRAFGGGEAAQAMNLHACTSTWNATRLDPYVNLLRVTTEAFSAITGGCDSLTTGCFDEAVRTPDEFSRRLARNTQIILRQEARLDMVADPAGGSWYVEKLTEALARQAWSLLQEIEGRGGMGAALLAGLPQEQVARAASARIADLERRKETLVGTNLFANTEEKPLEASLPARVEAPAKPSSRTGDPVVRAERLRALAEAVNTSPGTVMAAAVAAAEAGASLGEITLTLRRDRKASVAVSPLPAGRWAERFERLRAATEACRVRAGAVPKVFLANLGTASQFRARADFSKGFFQVAGLDVLDNDGFPDAAAAATAAAASGAAAVVICSNDDAYPELVPAFIQALRPLSPSVRIILAGYPEAQVQAHREAGVDDFVHIRANAYEFLDNFLRQLGVQS